MILKWDLLDRRLASKGCGHDERREQTDDANHDEFAMHEFPLPNSMSMPTASTTVAGEDSQSFGGSVKVLRGSCRSAGPVFGNVPRAGSVVSWPARLKT